MAQVYSEGHGPGGQGLGALGPGGQGARGPRGPGAKGAGGPGARGPGLARGSMLQMHGLVLLDMDTMTKYSQLIKN